MGSGQVAAARSSVLVGGDRTGMSWIDPHKRTLTVLVIERRGARRRALQDLRRRAPGSGGVGTVVGAIARWGVGNAAGCGRTAIDLVGRGYNVRDVCANPHRPPGPPVSAASPTRWTPSGSRARRGAHPLLPRVFNRAGTHGGADEHGELLALWHKRRRSLLKTPPAPAQRGRFPARRAAASAARAAARHQGGASAPGCPCAPQPPRGATPTTLRLRMLDDHRVQIALLDAAERDATAHPPTPRLTSSAASRSVAELLVEVGDPRHFTDGGFARFSGSAPLAASTAEDPTSRSATGRSRSRCSWPVIPPQVW